MRLPVQFRLTVSYRDIAGLRCREIAEIMACCEGTVMSGPHGGRQRLRTLLPGGRTSVPVRRRLRGPGVDAGSSVQRWVWPSSSSFFSQPEPGNLRLFP
jgi:hypothetical protein